MADVRPTPPPRALTPAPAPEPARSTPSVRDLLAAGEAARALCTPPAAPPREDREDRDAA